MSSVCYFDYSYDVKGRVTSIQREEGICIYYDYDKADRLTREAWNGPEAQLYAFSYGYDAAGNRAWKNIDGVLTYYQYDAAERLTQEVSEGKYTYYGWDRNGACTRIEKPDEDKYTYFEYNDARLLKKAHVLPEDRWNYFCYDGELNRYAIQDSQGLKYYYWDGLKLLERYNATADTARSFVHGTTPVAGVGSMVQFIENGSSYTFHYDHRGTVFDITDGGQDVAQTYEYDAWGMKLSETGQLANPIQYGGCAWLRSSDLPGTYHSPAGSYSSSEGRFRQRGLAMLGRPGNHYGGNAPTEPTEPSEDLSREDIEFLKEYIDALLRGEDPGKWLLGRLEKTLRSVLAPAEILKTVVECLADNAAWEVFEQVLRPLQDYGICATIRELCLTEYRGKTEPLRGLQLVRKDRYGGSIIGVEAAKVKHSVWIGVADCVVTKTLEKIPLFGNLLKGVAKDIMGDVKSNVKAFEAKTGLVLEYSCERGKYRRDKYVTYIVSEERTIFRTRMARTWVMTPEGGSRPGEPVPVKVPVKTYYVKHFTGECTGAMRWPVFNDCCK